MSNALQRLGMVGDGKTVALVSDQGSVDWLCLPRFDSPACCAALVGTRGNGYWSIGPEEPVTGSCQRYDTDTLILETELATGNGKIRLTDFMPVHEGHPMLVRIVTALSGPMSVESSLALRFDYGNMPPWIDLEGDTVSCRVGPDEVSINGMAGSELSQDTVRCRFELPEGGQRAFVLRYRPFDGGQPVPAEQDPDPYRLLAQTRRHWRDWIGRLQVRGDFEAALRRSLLTLKALVHAPTGGLVAAPTTSLPETPGGRDNWDYRYCWLRDASFTVDALISSGYHQEAAAWRNWILRAVAGSPEKMAIMYRVDGSRRLEEVELPWLQGHRSARPVRIGNAAAAQFQLDVYGELMKTLHLCEQAGMHLSSRMREVELALAEHVAKVWTEPDQGLWESRGQPRHYTYSKVMAWVAIDCLLRSAVDHGEFSPEVLRRFEELRSEIHAAVCSEGFDEGLGFFTSYFGGHEIDASLLLLPKLGFLPVGDPRMAATITAVEDRLRVDGLVYRRFPEAPPREGAFLACTLWLAECQLMQGRREDARASIERVLAVCGPLGMLSEEYDPDAGRMTGNYPQALSHTALINALLAYERSECSESGR